MVNMVKKDVYIGVPAIFDKEGIREILTLDLNKVDQDKFSHSCEVISTAIKQDIDPLV